MIGRVMCHVCGKEVDRVTEEREDYRLVIRVRAECHGEVDECEIDYLDLHRGLIVGGVAFGPKPSLPAPTPLLHG